MSIQDVAADMAAMFEAGDFHTPGDKYWSDDAVSIEPMAPPGMDPVARGKAALTAKGEWWGSNHDVANHATDGPYINGDEVGFHFEMDITVKATGHKIHMRELALYTIQDDKIVEERFLYGMG